MVKEEKSFVAPPSPLQDCWPRCRRGHNVCTSLLDRECGGRSLRSFKQFPQSMVTRLDKEYDSIPGLVASLNDAYVAGDVGRLKELLKRAWRNVIAYESESNMQRDNFIVYGGSNVLIRILFLPFDLIGARNSGWRGQVVEHDLWELKKPCIQLLKELCYFTPFLAEELGNSTKLIVQLFTLMKNRSIFEDVITLTEDIIACSREIFNLALVPDFEGLLNSYSKRQLACFCRILALVVFETEDRTNDDCKVVNAADLLTIRREQALSPAIKNSDRNHAVLLGVEAFLPRTISLISANTAPILATWASDVIMRLSSSSHHHELLQLVDVEEDDSWEDTQDESAISDPHANIKALFLLVHRVEILFVLCTLLSGKRKLQVQDKLYSLGIVETLSQAFEWLNWSDTTVSLYQERMHGPGCECNPESALRIQFLRLIHNLCDRENDFTRVKDQMLSAQELESVQEYAKYDQLRQLIFFDNPATWSTDAMGGRGQQPLDSHNPTSNNDLWFSKLSSSPGGAASQGDASNRDSWTSLDLEGNEAQPEASAHFRSSRSRGTKVQTGTCHASSSAADVSSVSLQRGSVQRPLAQPSESSRAARANPCDPDNSNRGLITKVLLVFMNEKPDSTYRFWLASCVEAFLRGSDARAQVFMAKMGLLDHLVDGILNFQISGNLQTNFDLLGELVKYNPEVFLMFSQTVDDAKYKVFMQVVVSNLVDSNVFIRAVVLSLEFFSFRCRELAALGSRYDMESCKLHKFLKHNTLRLLKDLMTVITVEDINQENICCLNTALSLFIFVRLHGRLNDYITAIRNWEITHNKVGFVTSNFLALLKFWLEYYLYRGKDCLSLELSSNIRFSVWRTTVNELLEAMSNKTESSSF